METLTYTVEDGVGLLLLNRPQALNAINKQLIHELGEVLSGLTDLRALILSGTGHRAFAAGADITEMASMTAMEAQFFAGLGQRVFASLEAMPFPTIAAVNGFALGGGCELALACDLIIAGPSATFGQPEVKLGVIPGFGGTQRLVRRVGRHRAMELILTGRNVKAEEAVQIGLALEVAEESAVDRAQEIARGIAKNGPMAVQLAKRAIVELDGATQQQGMDAERSLFGLCFATEDQKEGMAAFVEKRKAAFTGR